MQPVLNLREAERLVSEPVLRMAFEPLFAERSAALHVALRKHGEAIDRDRLHHDAMRWLSAIVGRYTNNLVFELFSAFRAVRNRLQPLSAATAASGPASTALIRDFAASDFWRDYLGSPADRTMLDAMLDRAGRNWLAAVEETIGRLLAERGAISKALLAGRECGPLRSLEFGLSDLHDEGRAVAIAGFAGGRIVYKPRSLAADRLWAELYADLVRSALGEEIESPAILSRDRYGFMSFVEHAACRDEGEVARCYRRYGVLLALAHGLGTNDLHHENIIVSGATPHVIDAETLLPAALMPNREMEAAAREARPVTGGTLETFPSVFELALLPVKVMPPRDREARTRFRLGVQEMGGLAAYGLEPVSGLVPVHVDTDALSYVKASFLGEAVPNLPRLGGAAALPAEHLDPLLEGFSAGYESLANAAGTVVERIRRAAPTLRVRLVPRPTRLYNEVLSRSISCEALQSETARREIIAADLAAAGGVPIDVRNSLEAAEAVQLFDGDIPRFEVGVEESHLAGAPLADPSRILFEKRLRGLCEADRKLQQATIALSLRASAAEAARGLPDSLPVSDLLGLIADTIEGAAQPSDGRIWWPFVSSDTGYSGTRVHADRESLYDGGAGTALALAELSRHLARPELGPTAKAALCVPDAGRMSAARGAGLARGLGGYVFALARTGSALGDDEPLALARSLLLDHGPALLRADGPDELVHGRAGLLVAALALHKVDPHPAVMALADEAVRLVTANARFEAGGCRWPVAGGLESPVHMAHGPTGIAVALAKWQGLRGDDETARVIRAAIAHDDALWQEDLRGWRHRDNQGAPAAGWSWCLGRAGTVSGQLVVARALGDAVDHDRLARSLGAEPGAGLATPGLGLCCGTAGILDSLLVGRRIAAQSGGAAAGLVEALDARIDLATDLLRDRDAVVKISPIFASLFSGCAGAAIGLARAADPEGVPSVVFFDA